MESYRKRPETRNGFVSSPLLTPLTLLVLHLTSVQYTVLAFVTLILYNAS